jgi:hypothetical protein
MTSRAGRESGSGGFVGRHGGTGKRAWLCRFCRLLPLAMLPHFGCDTTALQLRYYCTSAAILPHFGNDCIVLHTTNEESGVHSNTFVKSIHIRLTFRSRATVSTISREIAIVIASPSPSLRTSSPHSFSANAASSTRRFVARARSASVQRTTVCTAALPSGAGTVSYILSSGKFAVGPNEPKQKLSRVAGDALPPPSGELGVADSPSQPLVRFARFCGDDVMSTLVRT